MNHPTFLGRLLVLVGRESQSNIACNSLVCTASCENAFHNLTFHYALPPISVLTIEGSQAMVQERRRDTHMQVSDSTQLNVVIRRQSGDSDPDLVAEILDISCELVRLRLDERLPEGERIGLTIAATEVEYEIQSDARVCWSEPASSEGWVTGFELTEKFSLEAIDRLATNGALERRTDIRQPISFAADGKTELTHQFDALHVIDISSGGFCLLAKGELDAKPGERLMVRMTDHDAPENPVLVRARIAWVKSSEDGTTVGCTFFAQEDHMHMRRILNSEEVVNVPLAVGTPKEIATSWSMIAVAVALILVVLFF